MKGLIKVRPEHIGPITRIYICLYQNSIISIFYLELLIYILDLGKYYIKLRAN